jgi:hypothetical protein
MSSPEQVINVRYLVDDVRAAAGEPAAGAPARP